MKKWFVGVLLFIMYLKPTNSIHIRHDVTKSKYKSSLEDFPALSQIYKNGVFGVLIHPSWVITSGHSLFCITEQSVIKVGDTYQKVKGIYRHYSGMTNSKRDIALLHLYTPVTDIVPAILYSKNDEVKKVVNIIGKQHIKNSQPSEYKQSNNLSSNLFKAQNTLESASETELSFIFDLPSSSLNLEGSPGNGDSGSPAYIVNDGNFYVLGISSKTQSWFIPTGEYGVTEKYTRISTARKWILDVINKPKNRSMVSRPYSEFPKQIPNNHQDSLCKSLAFSEP